MRLVDSCITQLEAQGPSRTCHESKEEEEVMRVVTEGNNATCIVLQGKCKGRGYLISLGREQGNYSHSLS